MIFESLKEIFSLGFDLRLSMQFNSKPKPHRLIIRLFDQDGRDTGEYCIANEDAFNSCVLSTFLNHLALRAKILNALREREK